MKHNGRKTVDADLAGAGRALQRAATQAKELGLRTNTPVYVVRRGKTVNVTAARLRRAA